MATTSEAFQWIVEQATELTFECRGVVAQSSTRENVVRSISRGGRVWKFTVTPAPGLTYEYCRPYIARLDQADRVTPGTINLDHTNYSQFAGYLGQGSGTFTAVVPAGTGVTQITLTATGSPGAGYIARAGDLIQLGSGGSVYQVVTDPATGNGATITLNRPVDEAAGSYTTLVGVNVNWTVICTQMPGWSLVPGGGSALVNWDGDFVFYEDRT